MSISISSHRYTGKMLYADKEKALGYISVSAPIAEAQSSQELYDSAAKIVNNFENPEIISQEAGNDGVLFRDGETDDLWKDRSMGLSERMTLAATKLAANHKEDVKLKQDALKAIGDNLEELQEAMGEQRRFDRTTVKRVLTDEAHRIKAVTWTI